MTNQLAKDITFDIVLEVDEDGKYVVECTTLPGCLSEGDTIEEAIENITEAIVGCIKSRIKLTAKNYTADKVVA